MQLIDVTYTLNLTNGILIYLRIYGVSYFIFRTCVDGYDDNKNDEDDGDDDDDDDDDNNDDNGSSGGCDVRVQK